MRPNYIVADTILYTIATRRHTRTISGRIPSDRLGATLHGERLAEKSKQVDGIIMTLKVYVRCGHESFFCSRNDVQSSTIRIGPTGASSSGRVVSVIARVFGIWGFSRFLLRPT